MRAATCFFARVWLVTSKQHFRSKKNRAAKLVVLLSDCKRESGSESG
jgi:hypothetical protein